MQSHANNLARIESDWTLRDGVNSLISNISCTKQSNLHENGVMTTPKRRSILPTLSFTCFCITKPLLIRSKFLREIFFAGTFFGGS